MELIEGGALADLIAAGPLAPDVAAGHALRICEFLDKAHSFATTIEGEPYDRLVHADLKPAILLPSAAGEIMRARLRHRQGARQDPRRSPPTTGARRLRVARAARVAVHVNEHVDFWSLGVMLYEMLAGHRPYPQLETATAGAARARHHAPTNAREPLPDVVPAGARGHRQQAARVPARAPLPEAAPSGPTWSAFLETRCRRPSRNTRRRRPPRLPGSAAPAAACRRSRVPPTARSHGHGPPTDPLPLTGVTPRAPSYRCSTRGRPTPPSPLPIVRSACGARLALRRRVAGHAARPSWPCSRSKAPRGWPPSGSGRRSTRSTGGRSSNAKSAYDRIRGLGALDLGLRARVDGPLRERLVSIADARHHRLPRRGADGRRCRVDAGERCPALGTAARARRRRPAAPGR